MILFPKQADGKYPDNLGVLHDVKRNSGESDEDFRERIIDKIKKDDYEYRMRLRKEREKLAKNIRKGALIK